MILYLPALVFIAGLLLAERGRPLERLAGLLVMIGAAVWSFGLVVDWWLGALWALGPIAGSLLVGRRRARAKLPFEGLVRRTVIAVCALLGAAITASKLPIGENPYPLTGVLWFTGAVGLGWLLFPQDDDDPARGAVFATGGFAGVVMMAIPPGRVTAALAGAAVLLPAIAGRLRGPGAFHPAIRIAALAAAAAALVAAFANGGPFGVTLFDLRLNFGGLVLPGVAFLLLAGSLRGGADGWLAPVAALSLAAGSPALAWAALAGMVAAGIPRQRSLQATSWAALLMLLISLLAGALVSGPTGARVVAVAVAAWLTLLGLAASATVVRALVLPAAAFEALALVHQLTGGALTRLQVAAAAGAVLLLLHPVMAGSGTLPQRTGQVRDGIRVGLLLIAIASVDPLGLAPIAVWLLLLDIAVVRPSRSNHPIARLSRSGWPASAGFAGRVLAATAAVQASIGLGVAAVVLVAGLHLTTRLERGGARGDSRHPAWAPGEWVAAAASLAFGLAPALFLRMLHT